MESLAEAATAEGGAGAPRFVWGCDPGEDQDFGSRTRTWKRPQTLPGAISLVAWSRKSRTLEGGRGAPRSLGDATPQKTRTADLKRGALNVR